MTDAQHRAVYELLLELLRGDNDAEAHHGDCLGADEQFHGLANGPGLGNVWVVVHPPEDESYRAFCDGSGQRSPKPYLERNRDIVDETDALIAAPKSATEVTRSGTWSTVRYARERGKMIYIVLPSGEIKIEPGPTRPFSEIKRELKTA